MTTPSSSLPPANWYPDPQTPGQLRYWDGQAWTAHTHVTQQAAPGASGYPAQGSAGAGNPAAAGAAQAGGYGPQGGGYGPQGGGNQQGGAQAGGYGPQGGGYGPQADGYQQAGAQGAGYQQAGAQAAGYQQAGAQAAGYQQAGAQAAGYQQAGPQAAGYQQAGPQAAGPATGGMFVPGGAGGAPGQSFGPGGPSTGTVGVPALLQHDDHEGESAPLALPALVFGIAAIGANVLAVFKVGTPFDDYLAYAGAGLGFAAVLLGIIARRQVASGAGRGALASWLGIGLGFLAMGVSAYDILYPGELSSFV